MYFFTSITVNYIPKARIVATTLKQCDPDAIFILALSDNLPADFNKDTEPFDEILFTDELPIFDNPKSFFFRHNITEICTAVKPGCALHIMDKYSADKVCYLDPDIAVFSKLSEVEESLDTYSMVFTPHTTIPEEKENYIVGNEILFLKRGTNNLGFFAVKNDDEGRSFLSWWNKRVMMFCLDDDCTLKELLEEHSLIGLFTDQKWIDLVPSFFDNYLILKHPGYNVSTWNLSHRIITKSEFGDYYVNGQPLRFFHFSGVDSGAHTAVLNQLVEGYPKTALTLELSKWYLNQEEKCGQSTFKNMEWKYARYSNGELIPKIHRKIMLVRRDTFKYFDDPFEIQGNFCYYNWMIGEYGEYIEQVTGEHIEKTHCRDSTFVRGLKKIVKFFVKEDCILYMKLKKIWHAIK